MKISYDQISIEVEKLYGKTFPPGTEEKVIAEHCEYIAQYIEACGWTTENYLAEYIARSLNRNTN